jgi:hypothetical protein
MRSGRERYESETVGCRLGPMELRFGAEGDLMATA